MSHIKKHTQDQPSEHKSPIEELISWRKMMEAQLPCGDIMSLMHARNCVGTYRDKLAPWEWFRCLSCGGRGLWVDNGNRYCKRCSGTGILLVCEQHEPIQQEPVPTGWRSWLRRLGRLYPRKNIIARRLS